MGIIFKYIDVTLDLYPYLMRYVGHCMGFCMCVCDFFVCEMRENKIETTPYLMA